MSSSKRIHEPGHYMLKIESFSLLCEAKTLIIESDVFEASGHKWRLDLYPNGKEQNNHISLYLIICDTESLSDGWEVCVDVNLFSYNHKGQNYVVLGDGKRRIFNIKKLKWGFDELVSLDLFKDGGNGYLCNDSCVFGAEVFQVPEFTQKDRCLSLIKPLASMNTHTWVIDKFSSRTERLHSETFKVGKIKWVLSLHPQGEEKSGEHFSLFLFALDCDSLPDDWRIYLKYKLRVKNQLGNADLEQESEDWFCSSAVGWGYERFMPLSQLRSLENGFLVNDIIIVEVHISVVGIIKNFV